MKRFLVILAMLPALVSCEFTGDQVGGGVVVFRYEGCEYLKFGYPENKQPAVHSETCKNTKHTMKGGRPCGI